MAKPNIRGMSVVHQQNKEACIGEPKHSCGRLTNLVKDPAAGTNSSLQNCLMLYLVLQSINFRSLSLKPAH
jgi:hypothetical protein